MEAPDDASNRPQIQLTHLETDRREITDEEYCDLPPPVFHQFRDSDRAFRFLIAGNGITFQHNGRRGCIRTEVANKTITGFHFKLSPIQGRAVVTAENDFSTGKRVTEISTTISPALGMMSAEVSATYTRSETGLTSSPSGLLTNIQSIRQALFDVVRTSAKANSTDDTKKADGNIDTPATEGSSGPSKTTPRTSVHVPEQGMFSNHHHTVETMTETSSSGNPDLEAQQRLSERRSDSSTTTEGNKKPHQYVVIGLFSRVTGIPRERLVIVKKPKHLFRRMRWGIIKLRGIEAFLSLRGVKGFAIYEVC
jgi:hypothetical protein